MGNSLILAVEDEPAIQEMLQFALQGAGFDFMAASDANAARQCINQRFPDLILLDWMLPGISGADFARRLRCGERGQNIPIIMLTARTEEDYKLESLDAGADDYITKPFSTRELIARIRAVLRRTRRNTEQGSLQVQGLVLDPVSQRVSINDHPLNLGPTEYRLLFFFMSHQERVFSRVQLLDQVWGDNVYIEERTVDVHIRRLRKAMSENDCDGLLQTVRGSGYRFSTKVA